MVYKSPNKNSVNSDDKPDGSPVNVNDVKHDDESDEFYRNQDEKRCSKVHGGDCTDEEVVKSIEAFTINTLLQVILAMILCSVKTLQEQFLLIARYSNLSPSPVC